MISTLPLPGQKQGSLTEEQMHWSITVQTGMEMERDRCAAELAASASVSMAEARHPLTGTTQHRSSLEPPLPDYTLPWVSSELAYKIAESLVPGMSESWELGVLEAPARVVPNFSRLTCAIERNLSLKEAWREAISERVMLSLGNLARRSGAGEFKLGQDSQLTREVTEHLNTKLGLGSTPNEAIISALAKELFALFDNTRTRERCPEWLRRKSDGSLIAVYDTGPVLRPLNE